ncbi:hypothetical protein [Pseudomonas viridiflava]|uniref:hypothetical protein n=1 Tax=Pseudomonas viridiflava TaxID=33069 RepID=UPI0013CEB6DC|nr:hypothetical protein [Pseudomonas viridiflava]
MALPEVAVNNQNSTAKTEVSIDLPLTDDLRYILGRQSYTCASQATVLRMLGYQIAESAQMSRRQRFTGCLCTT